jgi:hypothetical protein
LQRCNKTWETRRFSTPLCSVQTLCGVSIATSARLCGSDGGGDSHN